MAKRLSGWSTSATSSMVADAVGRKPSAERCVLPAYAANQQLTIWRLATNYLRSRN
jgi:hypothetical protein